MVYCKNTGGAPSDGDESPPRLTEVARGKHKKIAIKKRKRTLTEAEITQTVADAVDLAKRGAEAVGFTLASVAFILKVDSLVQRPLRRQRTHLQSSPQRSPQRRQRRQRSTPFRLHRVVAQDVRVLR
jgi:hypothetical protein